MSRPGLRVLLLGLVLCVVCAAAWADDAGREAAAPAAQAPLTPQDMEKWLTANPLAFGLLILLRYGTVAVGVVLLVLAWRRRDRIRAGLESPPVHHEPTLAFTPGRTISILFAFFLGAQLVALAIERSVEPRVTGRVAVEATTQTGVTVRVVEGSVAVGDELRVRARDAAQADRAARVTAILVPTLASDVPAGTGPAETLSSGAPGEVRLEPALALATDDELDVYAARKPPLLLALGLNAAIFLPLAGIVFLRRRRLAVPPPPRAPAAVRTGLWTFCVANAVSVPALLVSLVALQALGEPVTVYGPVQEVVGAADPWVPWVLAFYAVVVAPLGEESVFRGMLYPALKSAVGGGRRGSWIAAVVVSALFALVHFHALSFLPLFALALVLAWVFERTNSLGAVMWAHAFFNGASMLPLLVRVAS